MSDLDDIAAFLDGTAPVAPKHVPSGPITPRSGIFKYLTPAQRDAVEVLATRMTTDANAGRFKEAWVTYHNCAADQHEQIALWHLLDSKTRTALKRNQ